MPALTRDDRNRRAGPVVTTSSRGAVSCTGDGCGSIASEHGPIVGRVIAREHVRWHADGTEPVTEALITALHGRAWLDAAAAAAWRAYERASA